MGLCREQQQTFPIDLVLLDNGRVQKNTGLVQQQRPRGMEVQDEGVQRGEIRVCLCVCVMWVTQHQ